MANTFEMTLYLSSFRGARTITQEDEYGNMEAGVFIPFERNGIKTTKNRRAITWGFVQELDVPQRGFTHRVLQKTNPSFVQKERQRGYDPILIARMKPTKFYHRKPKFINNRVIIEDGIEI